MDNPEISEITVNNDEWTPVFDPVHYEPDARDTKETEKNKPEKKHTSKPLLMTVQIILCMLIMLTLYGIKTFGKDLFKEIDKWYQTNLNNEIIITENFDNFSLDELINAVKNK